MHEEATSVMSTDIEWEKLKDELLPGMLLDVTVEQHCPFGVFVRIPSASFRGLVEIVNFRDQGRMTSDQFPPPLDL